MTARKKLPYSHRPTYIRAWRKFRGITIEQLAEAADCSPGNISQLERGAQGYSQEMLEAIADALNCLPGQLLDYQPERPAFIGGQAAALEPAEVAS